MTDAIVVATNRPPSLISKRKAPLRWVRWNRLLLGGFVPLLVAIVAAILLAGVGAVLRKEVYDKTSQDYRLAIHSIANQKTRGVLQWIRWHELQMKEWVRRDEFLQAVQSLASNRNRSNSSTTSSNRVDDTSRLRRPPGQNSESSSASASEISSTKFNTPAEQLQQFFDGLSLHVGFLDQSIYDAVVSASDKQTHAIEYSIWDRNFEHLAGNLIEDTPEESQTNSREFESVPADDFSDLLVDIFKTHSVQIRLTHPPHRKSSEQASDKELYPASLPDSPTSVVFGVPIFFSEADDQPPMALLVRSQSLSVELEQILSDIPLRDSNCYLVTDRGIISTPVLDRSIILSHHAIRVDNAARSPQSNDKADADAKPTTTSLSPSSNIATENHLPREKGPSKATSGEGNLDRPDTPQTQKQPANVKPISHENAQKELLPVLYARDPGGELLKNQFSNTPPETWPLTASANGVVLHQTAQEFLGYRDYRGKQVVGAWRWIERANAGLVLEIPYDQAYSHLNYINRSFAVMISVPLITALGLIALSIIRYARRKPNLENKRLGSYQLGPKIGEGGLGVVYRGEHRMLGRQAAIKVIKPNEVSAESIRHFENEVRLAAKLQHPNAVSIYDFGVGKDGTLYCAMELVDGVTLCEMMSTSPPLPISRIIHILQCVASALESAHRLQLVHRDVKPQNIMLSRSPIPDTIKVVDFGLAKDIAETLSQTRRTNTALIGSPGYLAPERIDRPSIVDPRVDIFSWGVLGLHLISLEVPPLGVTQESYLDSIKNPLIRTILHSQKESSAITSEVAGQINKLINLLLQCAAVDPKKRPDDFYHPLEVLKSLSSLPSWSREDAENWWDQHKTPNNSL